MNTQRWLLPFTHAVDLQAIDAVVRLAEHSAATLVALSLIAPRPGQRRAPRVRLEDIQESRDFLEAVRWKALRLQVSMECHEIFTADVPGSIATQVQELDCQSVLLTHHGIGDALLSPHDVKQVLMNPPGPVLFLTLPPAKRNSLQDRSFLTLLRRVFGQLSRGQQTLPGKTDRKYQRV
jgi:hypothetical protein